jgi:hypothetical protein
MALTCSSAPLASWETVLAVSWAVSVVSRDTPDIISLAEVSWSAVSACSLNMARMESARSLRATAKPRRSPLLSSSAWTVKSLSRSRSSICRR